MIIKKGRTQTQRPTTLPARFEPKFWAEADQRCAVVREIRRRYDELVADAGADSAQKLMLCQRAIFLNVQLETLEVQAAQEGHFDAGTYTQMVNALSGLLTKLGLGRAVKPAVDLHAYVRERTA